MTTALEILVPFLICMATALLFYRIGYRDGFVFGIERSGSALRLRHDKWLKEDWEELKGMVTSLSPSDESVEIKALAGNLEKRHNLGLIGDEEFARQVREIKKRIKTIGECSGT